MPIKSGMRENRATTGEPQTEQKPRLMSPPLSPLASVIGRLAARQSEGRRGHEMPDMKADPVNL
jgi:hypothetical protein